MLTFKKLFWIFNLLHTCYIDKYANKRRIYVFKLVKAQRFGYETRSPKMNRMQWQGKVRPKKKRNKPTSKQNITSPQQKPLRDKFISSGQWVAIHVYGSVCESCGHSLCTGKCYYSQMRIWDTFSVSDEEKHKKVCRYERKTNKEIKAPFPTSLTSCFD